MADRYVKFPGLAGSLVETDDVNLLDADTAHLQQSVGRWAIRNQSPPTGIALSQAIAPAFGDYVAGLDVTQAITGFIYGTAWTDNPIPVSGGEVLTVSIALACDAARSGVFHTLTRETEGGSTTTGVSDPVVLSPGLSRFDFDVTIPAGATLFRPSFILQDGVGGDMLYFDAVCLRVGTETGFVQSLRIVGTLFEEIEPADMPIVFAGDGTPLTIGDGWAGDGYHYRRYDGPDNTAPIVASFDAEDIVLP